MAINFDYKKNGQIPLYLFFAAFEPDVSFPRHPIHKIQVSPKFLADRLQDHAAHEGVSLTPHTWWNLSI